MATKIRVKSRLSHNNSGYGYGKFYVAVIRGTHPKYKYNREFLQKEVEKDYSSKTTWYSFVVEGEVEENSILEIAESNAYKSYKEYYRVEGGELKEIEEKEIKNYLQEV